MLQYIDKSELIEKTNLLINTRQKFLCVNRPRRFGKSMAADMPAAYYGRCEDSSELFTNLKISRMESYKKHLNQYDVIKINMQEFLSMTHSVDEMLSMLGKYLIFDLAESFEQVRFWDKDNLIQVMKDIFLGAKRSFMILIDEWDCLFREYQLDTDAQKRYLDFLRVELKDQEYINAISTMNWYEVIDSLERSKKLLEALWAMDSR
ncbi:AAA family ATPase [Parablautia intestinalis]|uniref:AAA family ATPase n=1 Tax=Parablautia intestinalis TaxID=2320100 RepID=UPI002ED4C402